MNLGLNFENITIYELLGNNELNTNTAIAVFDAIYKFVISINRANDQHLKYQNA